MTIPVSGRQIQIRSSVLYPYKAVPAFCNSDHSPTGRSNGVSIIHFAALLLETVYPLTPLNPVAIGFQREYHIFGFY